MERGEGGVLHPTDAQETILGVFMRKRSQINEGKEVTALKFAKGLRKRVNIGLNNNLAAANATA